MNKYIITIIMMAAALLCATGAARATDTQPPTITITQPAEGSSLSGVVTICASAADDVGVASVSFMLDGAPFASPVASPPFNAILDTAGLSNGAHTLLAIATDAAGNTGRCAWMQITVTNPARYTLGPGPFTVEDLGSVLSVNKLDRPTYFRLNNETHLLLFYLANYGTNKFQILDLNLSQGTAQLTDGASLGRIGVRGTVLYNRMIYICSGEAAGKGYFLEYNPATGDTREIAQTTGGSPGQSAEIGDDGWIYIGGYPNAFVDRYNPNSDTYERLGSMGTKPYSYTLGADMRYLYVGLGKEPWFLAVYDTQTKNITHHWADAKDFYAAVRRSTDGNWYYQREGPTTDNKMVWYQLTNGVPLQLAKQPDGLFVQNAQRGNVVDGVKNGYLMGYEVNLDDATPNSINNYATIKYRKVGDSDWQSVGIGGFHLAPVAISRLYPWNSSTQLMGFSSFYGPVFLWDINSRKAAILGYPQYNLYNGIFGQGVAYFSGYDAATLRYDPARPWTLTATTPNFFDANVNPYQISLKMSTHNYYSTFGADGFVYVGAHHDRGTPGGELGWYDPSSGRSGSLRTPFLDYDISDLKPALGGTKLVYASKSDKLFVFDAAAKPMEIERTIVPLPGIGMDKVVEVAPGIMFGATGSYIFAVNIADGSLIYSKTLPGQDNTILGKAFAESISPPSHRLVLGPDGYIWMFVWYRDSRGFNRSSLYRVNPQDGTYNAVLTDTFYKYGDNNIMFNGGDMYLYGGTNLYWIANILVPTTEIIYDDVSGDGSLTAYDAALALQLGRTELEAAGIAQKTVGTIR